MVIDLAEALWHDRLGDPAAPAAALAADIEQGAPYRAMLTRLQGLADHGMPLTPALTRALDLYPWSIDLALLAVRAGDGTHDAQALQALDQRTAAQNRRRAALAWALWSRGRAEEARAALRDLDPASESFDGDRAARAELAILSDQTPEAVPGPRGRHLALLRLYRTRGAAALAAQIDAGALPDHPPLWPWLIETLVIERDFTRARAVLAQMAARRGANHPETRAQRIRLALDCGDCVAAGAWLRDEPDPDRPWAWPARRLVQHLRGALMQAADHPGPELVDFCARARRLYPRHPGLRALSWSLREATDDWDALADDLTRETSDPTGAARALCRIGQPERALIVLDRAEAAAPDTTPDGMARRHQRRAEALMRLGRLEAARAALGPPPSGPQRAEHAYWAAEIALAQRDPARARVILDETLLAFPTRMGLHIDAARARFLSADPGRRDLEQAMAHLETFRVLKTAQTGTPPPDDLRDRILRDALAARAEGRDAGESPGLAAQAMARLRPVFSPVDGPAIPRRLGHYWEGPRSAPLTRAIGLWADLHPGFDQRVFGADEATAWLARHAPDLVAPFARLSQPASRADLFRLAWMVTEGGVFADLDELPRHAITPWLAGARAVLVIEEGHATVANNFLAAVPRLALLERTLARVRANLRSGAPSYPWWDSGPAPLTVETLRALRDPVESPGLRVLQQAAYDSRVATNLPYPHKRRPDHWR